MQGEQLPLTGGQGRVFLLTSPLIGLANDSGLLVSYVLVNIPKVSGDERSRLRASRCLTGLQSREDLILDSLPPPKQMARCETRNMDQLVSSTLGQLWGQLFSHNSQFPPKCSDWDGFSVASLATKNYGYNKRSRAPKRIAETSLIRNPAATIPILLSGSPHWSFSAAVTPPAA